MGKCKMQKQTKIVPCYGVFLSYGVFFFLYVYIFMTEVVSKETGLQPSSISVRVHRF